MDEILFPGFERRRLPGDGIEIDAVVGGSGPPLLLLHGYPQTRACWHRIAPRLAERFTVVCPDLRGYGRSDKPGADPGHESYSKRRMARDQIATMQALGFANFFLAGHDRGARVGYRLALDHPRAVRRLAVLDILPTAEVWRAMGAEQAQRSYHWQFLAQPAPLPETLIGADPQFFLRWTLESWAAPGFRFDPAALADYRDSFGNPATVRASCEDYRAGWTADRLLDEAERGQRIACPVLVLTGGRYGVAKQNPEAVWRDWTTDLTYKELSCGHFLAEEAPAETATALEEFFG